MGYNALKLPGSASLLLFVLLVLLKGELLMVMSQGQDPSLENEYSPSQLELVSDSSSQRYFWMYGDWTSCSQECGIGYQLRAVTCMDSERRVTVDQQLCSPFDRPETNQTCNQKSCENIHVANYEWIPGHWGECSVDCGAGEQTQIMHCIETDIAGNSDYVSDSVCARHIGPKPVYQKVCNGDAENCPYWATGAWNECSVTCGVGRQFRRVYCQQDPPDGAGISAARNDKKCATEGKPSDSRQCSLQPCRDGSNRDDPYVNPREDRGYHQDCTTSRFGCCPDDITSAKGTNDFGCEAGFSGGIKVIDGRFLLHFLETCCLTS